MVGPGVGNCNCLLLDNIQGLTKSRNVLLEFSDQIENYTGSAGPLLLTGLFISELRVRSNAFNFPQNKWTGKKIEVYWSKQKLITNFSFYYFRLLVSNRPQNNRKHHRGFVIKGQIVPVHMVCYNKNIIQQLIEMLRHHNINSSRLGIPTT